MHVLSLQLFLLKLRRYLLALCSNPSPKSQRSTRDIYSSLAPRRAHLRLKGIATEAIPASEPRWPESEEINPFMVADPKKIGWWNGECV
jgi:hypothetical protein